MRRYKQVCGLAVGLDVIGERWTLLIVRDLLMGPKRYSDLLGGLPGLGTNLLSTRLKTLEAHGIVEQRRLPPPAASTVYELSESGRALEETVLALARWGMRFFSTCEDTDLRRLSWPLLGLRGGFDPERAGDLAASIQLEAADEFHWLTVREGRFASGDGQIPAPDVVASADPACFRQLLFTELSIADAIAAGRLRVDGDPELLQRAFRVFRFSR